MSSASLYSPAAKCLRAINSASAPCARAPRVAASASNSATASDRTRWLIAPLVVARRDTACDHIRPFRSDQPNQGGGHTSRPPRKKDDLPPRPVGENSQPLLS